MLLTNWIRKSYQQELDYNLGVCFLEFLPEVTTLQGLVTKRYNFFSSCQVAALWSRDECLCDF